MRHLRLINFETLSNTPPQLEEDDVAGKPTIEEVLKYAKGNIIRFVGEFAADLPQEQKEEIEQSCYVRLLQAYDRIDPDQGWRSFVFNHCRGGVLDYVKFGKGFEESKWSIQKEEDAESRNISKIKSRIQEAYSSQDGTSDQTGIEDILNSFGIAASNDDGLPSINWHLVAHMAAQDEAIHAFAKYLLGFNIEEISQIFGICKARVSQLIQAFSERFDDPALAGDPWLLQTIYAFGLCRHFGLPEVDQSEVLGFMVGWGSQKVDLMSSEPFMSDALRQMSLFDVG